MSALSSAAVPALLTWQPRAGGRSPAEDDTLDRDAADVTAGAIIFGRPRPTSSRLPRAISFTQQAPRDPLASQDLESGSDLKTVSTAPHPQDKNLIGQPLELCRSKLDAAMGWDGSGFCSYSPRDVHQQGVCVMLSKEFREMSKFEDGLDIAAVSEYVPGTGRRHWCLPVWAFAAAVERDQSNMEDLSLDCRRTNSYVRDILRQNFLLQGPSKTYQTGPAAKMLEDRCTPEGIRLHEQKRREREKWIEHEKRCLAKKYKIGKQDIVGWWDEDEHTCYEGFYDHNGMWNPYYMAGEWKRWCTTM